MESVDFFDKHLDPPDYPTRSECDNCGCDFDNGDLTKTEAGWLCDECIEDGRKELVHES